MSDLFNQDEAIQEALADLNWSISRSGRDWGEDEMLAKHALLPQRLEVVQRKLLGTQTERLRMLAALLENVGLDLTQQLVRAAERKPSDWRECLESRCRDLQDLAKSGGGDGTPEMATQLQPGSSARTWNYRAIRFEHGDESHVAIHEVHYEGGQPVAYAEGPAPVMWFEEEGPENGFKVLARLREALAKPVLTVDDFHPQGHKLGFRTGIESPSVLDSSLPNDVLPDVEGSESEAQPGAVELVRAKGGASADFSEELLSSGCETTTYERLASNAEFRDGMDQELAAWDNMRAVGRERFWEPAANRYPLKTLLELKKLRSGAQRLGKGSREAKRARMRQFICQASGRR